MPVTPDNPYAGPTQPCEVDKDHALLLKIAASMYALANAGGTGGGPATIADGADATQGAKADAAVINPASSASLVALLKGILTEDLAINGKITACNTGAVVLAAGTAVAGKFTIDQTTPGTTNRIVAAGTAADNAAASGNPVQIGGVAVTSASYSPAYTDADATILAVDKASGGLLCDIRKLTRADDAISADPKQLSTSSGATPGTTDQTVFTLAAGQKGLIQNLSADAPLAYKFGASASTSSFNGILKASTAADDGTGGIIVIDDWIGAVSVAKITGTARYIATKLS